MSSFTDELLEVLGRALFEAMERLDPNYDENWDNLPDRLKSFYKRAIEDVLERRGAAARSFLDADDDMVGRRPDRGK